MTPSLSRPGAAAAVLAAVASGCSLWLLPPTSAPGEATNLVLSGEVAYLALGERGLGVYQLASRSMVEVLPPEAEAGSVDDLALADGLLFAAPPVPLSRLELPGAGFTPGAAKPANFALEAALTGRTLLVAHGAGLAAVDVGDPAAPRLLSLTSLPVRPVNVDAAGGVAAVVGSDPVPRLVLVDVRDPAAPRLRRTVDLPAGSHPVAVALGEGLAVVAAREGGVVVVER